MIRMRTLGALDLRDGDGAEVRDILRQPKTFGVLAYLALARPRGYQRRDTLLAMFWPELDAERARKTLAQRVYELRRALGAAVVENRGAEELRVAGALLDCDVVAFDAALAAGNVERALELYRGPLLDGFHISDAAGFERWLDTERSRLEHSALDAALRLCARQRESGDAASAVRWTRRALEIAPFDERALRSLLHALDAAGDRAGALQAYDDFSRRLALEYETSPSPETQAVAESLRTAPVNVPEPGRRPAVSAPAHATRDADVPRRRRMRSWQVAVGVTLLAVLGSVWAVQREPEPVIAEPPATRVAVLFFQDESDGELGFESAALNSTIIGQLSSVGPLDVISQNGVRPYRGRDVPATTVADSLHAGLVVAGSLTPSGDRLRAFVELIDGKSGTSQSAMFEQPRGELFALADSVSARILEYLLPTIGRQVRQEQWRGETDDSDALRLVYEAEELYAQSLEQESRGDFDGAHTLLNRADTLLLRAMQRDRDWAQPWVTASRLVAHGKLMTLVHTPGDDVDAPDLDRALAYTRRALEVDGKSAAAHEAHGTLLHRKWLLPNAPTEATDSLLSLAEKHLRRSLELDRRRPRAEATLSMVFTAQGRFGEARRAAERAYHADAYQLDLVHLVVRLFQTSFETGDDDAAQAWCDEVERRMPGAWPVAYCKLLLHAWSDRSTHDAEQALYIHGNAGTAEPAKRMDAMRPMLDLYLAGALARAGMPDSARAIIARTEPAYPGDPSFLEDKAMAWMALGEDDRAAACIAEFLEVRPGGRDRVAAKRVFQPLAETSGSANRRCK